jgi:hypothetical protein
MGPNQRFPNGTIRWDPERYPYGIKALADYIHSKVRPAPAPQPGTYRAGDTGCARRMKIAQGWPKLWANFKALVGIFSQSVGPSLAIWANPVQFSFRRYWSRTSLLGHALVWPAVVFCSLEPVSTRRG